MGGHLGNSMCVDLGEGSEALGQVISLRLLKGFRLEPSLVRRAAMTLVPWPIRAYGRKRESARQAMKAARLAVANSSRLCRESSVSRSAGRRELRGEGRRLPVGNAWAPHGPSHEQARL